MDPKAIIIISIGVCTGRSLEEGENGGETCDILVITIDIPSIHPSMVQASSSFYPSSTVVKVVWGDKLPLIHHAQSTCNMYSFPSMAHHHLPDIMKTTSCINESEPSGQFTN